MGIEIVFDDNTREESEGRLNLWLDQRIGFSLKRRLAFYRTLSRKLRNGEMINRVLLNRAEQAEKFSNVWEARILRRIERILNDEGTTFAYTLQPYIPEDEFTMLLSGEQADDLPSALDMICDTRTRVAALQKEFRGAWVEPAGYIAIVVVTLSIAAQSALPQLARTFEHNGTSSTALSLMLTMTQIGTIPVTLGLVGLMAGTAFAVRWSLPRMRGRVRVWLEVAPPWSVYRDIQGYLWICSFLAQCKIGVADVDVLENQAEESRSPWLTERLSALRDTMVDEGVTLPRAMDMTRLNFPNPEIVREIDDVWGDEGDYDTLLTHSLIWVNQIEDRTRAQIRVVRGVTNFVSIMLVGAIVLLEIFIGQDMIPR